MKWNIDKHHAEVGFSVRHLMVSKVRGVFKDFEAEIEIDEDRLENSRLVARIEAASIDTKEPDRDAHLRSPDFFDAEVYPQLLFESRHVRRVSDDRFEVDGDLTIKNVTRSITLKGDLEGPISDPWGNRRLGVSVAAEIDREDFGLTWNMAVEAGGVLVGKTVKITIDAELTQEASQTEPAGAVAAAEA